MTRAGQSGGLPGEWKPSPKTVKRWGEPQPVLEVGSREKVIMALKFICFLGDFVENWDLQGYSRGDHGVTSEDSEEEDALAPPDAVSGKYFVDVGLEKVKDMLRKIDLELFDEDGYINTSFALDYTKEREVEEKLEKLEEGLRRGDSDLVRFTEAVGDGILWPEQLKLLSAIMRGEITEADLGRLKPADNWGY